MRAPVTGSPELEQRESIELRALTALPVDRRHAAEHGLGRLGLDDVAAGTPLQSSAVAARTPLPQESRGALSLHTSLVEQLPPLLRIYVGCAAVLYFDFSGFGQRPGELLATLAANRWSVPEVSPK